MFKLYPSDVKTGEHGSSTSLILNSSRAVLRPTPVWRISKPTCAHTLARNPTSASMKVATKPSPMRQTEPNTRTGHTPTRYTGSLPTSHCPHSNTLKLHTDCLMDRNIRNSLRELKSVGAA